MDIIWTLICGHNSKGILFCTAHGLPGWAAHACDITKKLWAEGTMEELLCSTAGEETWILLPPLDFHLSWAPGSQHPCWVAWHRTLLLQFLYLFCPRKALTGGEEAAKKRHLLPQMSWWSLFGLSLSLYLGLQPLWCRSLLSALGSSCLWFSLWYLATWCVFQDITSCLGTFLYSSLIPSL